jgi:hypothetical protein
MRRSSLLILSLALVSSSVAHADDATAPPPTASVEGGGFHGQGGLFDRSPQRRPQELSFFLGLPFYYGFGLGLGARYYIPILHDGFIPSINDEFGIEFGADFAGSFVGYFLPEVDIPVEVMWNFHFTRNFSAYAKAGVALEMVFANGAFGPYTQTGFYVTARPVGSVGLHLRINDTLNFRVEGGYPWVKVGLGINL